MTNYLSNMNKIFIVMVILLVYLLGLYYLSSFVSVFLPARYRLKNSVEDDHTTQVNTHVKTSSQDEEGTSDEKDSEKASMISEAMAMIAASSKSKLMTTIKNSCLPKLICELNASHKEKLSESEKSLLAMIRETSISVTAEVTSRYHFAAHMGQLIAGVDGAGCHNFYPSCPFPGMQVLQMLNKVRVVAR